MTERELSNRYYSWNGKTVFIRGGWTALWNGDACEMFVCEKNPSRTHLYDSPFRVTEETIKITEKVLSELKPLQISCESCVYCQDTKLPIGKFAVNGWERGKSCDLKAEVNGRSNGIPDGAALSPDCPCFAAHPLTNMTTAANEKLEHFSETAFRSCKAWFIASDYGFPDEDTIFALFGASKSIYVLDYNEVSDTDFEHNRKVNWTIRAWCEISAESHAVQSLRSIWDAAFFRSEGTAAICSLEEKRMLFLPFGIPTGYYVFSEGQEDLPEQLNGTRIQWA